MPAFTSRRRHGGRWWGIGTTAAAAVVALFLVALAGAAKPPSGSPSGPFPVPNGPLSVAAGFEGNDANTPPENTVPSGFPTSPTSLSAGYKINFDWNSLVPSGLTNPAYSGTAPYQTAGTTTSGWLWTALTDAQKSTTDTGFGGGVKQDDNCPAVQGGSAPNKDDLKRAYLATKVVGGHTYLELGWVRIPQNTTSPSAHIAFEFNQNSPDATTGSPCGGNSDGLVNRKGGDLLLLYDFTGGGTVPPTVTLSRWITSGTCGVSSHTAPCWGPFTALDATEAEANVDTGLSHLCSTAVSGSCGPNETDINGSTPSQGTTYTLPSSTSDKLAPTTETVGASEFGEATVDLTASGVFSSAGCTSFGQVEAVSRSSGDSGTAAMEDLVGPGSFTLSNCGEIKIVKTTDPANQDQSFPFNTNIGSNGGSDLSCTIAITNGTPDTFSLNGKDDTTTTTVNETTQDCTNVLPSSLAVNYTVGEGTSPTNWSFTKVVCTSANGTSTISPTATSGSPNTTSPGTETITLASEDVVTCTYLNTKAKNSPSATSAPSLIPNDSVTVSGLDTTGSASGTADQKMTVSLYDNATCTGTAKFSQTFTVTANQAYKTTNDGDPNNATLKGYTISGDQTATQYNWGVVYNGDSRNNGFSYCASPNNEYVIVTIHGKS